MRREGVEQREREEGEGEREREKEIMWLDELKVGVVNCLPVISLQGVCIATH